MTAYDSLLDAVGGTPIVRLNRLGADLAPTIYVKLEYLNPGGSVKDRAARWMVLGAIRSGALAPGGTIVEGTSGNTGIGLAQAAAQLGYPIVVVLPDKTSQEKLDTLRAYGARVVVTASGLPQEHPESVRRIAERLVAEIPGAWLAGQFVNPDNPQAHRESTGPEIWADTAGRVTHLVAGIGTGGTITGNGTYLKEISGGRVRVVGADPETSVYSGGDGSAFFVEATGRYRHPETIDDAWPETFVPEVVDRFERIGDREAIHALLRLARQEGILVGGSSGLVLAAALRTARDLGPDDVVVALLPDSGRAYLSKYLNEDWVRRFGFVDDEVEGLGPRPDAAIVRDVVGDALSGPTTPLTLSADLPVGVGRDTLESARRDGRLTAESVVPVLLPRARRDHEPSVAEVLGVVDLASLRAAATGAPAGVAVGDVAVRGTPVVGTGEILTDALARWDTGIAEGLVLRDGRVVAVVRREVLEAGAAAPVTAVAPVTAADDSSLVTA